MVDFAFRSDDSESVSTAAFKHKGKIYTAPTHGQAILKAAGRKGDIDSVAASGHDGFMTSKGRFVDRSEASIIARKANQESDRPIKNDTLYVHNLRQD